MEVIQRIFGSKVAERLKRRLILATGIHWEMKRLRPNVSSHLQTVLLARRFRIGTVIDVGANTGQFAEGLMDFGFGGRVISFEPVEQAHRQLRRRAQRHDNWVVYRRCALGSDFSHGSINVSRASVFSSLLDIEAAHAEAKPASRVVAAEPVEVLPLDSVTEELEIEPRSTLLKIDTQGFERQVIEGAGKLIEDGLAGVKVEMPVFPIYQGTEWLFEDIYGFLRGNGYLLYALNPEGVDEVSGRTNTLDGTFFRESAGVNVDPHGGREGR